MGFLEDEIKKKKILEKYNQLLKTIYKWKEFAEEPRGEPEFDVFMEELLEVMEAESE